MSQSMRPSHWTSSYNDQFRNHATKHISPNPGEPMHHFPGYIDPSHYQKDPGFFGLRATLASAARSDSLARGEEYRGPTPGAGPVGYGSAPQQGLASGSSRGANLAHTFYASPPAPHTQNYSALRQSVGPLSPTRTQPLSPGQQGGMSGFGAAPEEQIQSPASRGAPQYKDLWSAPILPHGDRSSYGPPRPEQYGQQTQQQMSGQGGYGYGNGNGSGSFPQPSSSSARFGSSGGQLVDSAFVAPPGNVWRYDARGVAQTREIELNPNTDPRNKFHIPGYAGYVRGKDNVVGQTFAKATRACLDVPLHLPTEIQ